MDTSPPAVVLISGIRGGIGRHVAVAVSTSGLKPLPVPDYSPHRSAHSDHTGAVVGVVNCAGKGMSSSSDHSLDEIFEANVEVTRTCIRVSESHDVPLVHLGSALEYVGSRTDAYVQTKRMASELIHAAQANPTRRLRAVQLSLHNVYGPRVKGSVTDVVKQHVAGQPILLRQPAAVRDFVYVSDVAASVVCALDLGDYPTPIPIGTGAGTSIARLAEIVSEYSGVRPPWMATAAIQDQEEAFSLVADTEMASEVLNWRASVGLPHGVGSVFGSMMLAEQARRLGAR